MARLTAVNRRLMSQSAQQLDSGPESDADDVLTAADDDLRLKLDLMESRYSVPSSTSTLQLPQVRSRNNSWSGSAATVVRQVGADDVLSKERKYSNGELSGGEMSTKKSSVQRRFSQTLEDAFLEQLPECNKLEEPT